VESVAHGEWKTGACYRKRVERNEAVSKPIGNGSLKGGGDGLGWEFLERNHWR
jgi:hypothetical protein